MRGESARFSTSGTFSRPVPIPNIPASRINNYSPRSPDLTDPPPLHRIRAPPVITGISPAPRLDPSNPWIQTAPQHARSSLLFYGRQPSTYAITLLLLPEEIRQMNREEVRK